MRFKARTGKAKAPTCLRRSSADPHVLRKQTKLRLRPFFAALLNSKEEFRKSTKPGTGRFAENAVATVKDQTHAQGVAAL